jgi:hypothetical protein
MIVCPLLVLVVAAFIGRNKKVGKAAVAVGYLYLVIDLAVQWGIWVTPASSNDGIALLVIVFLEMLVASAILALAFFQRPTDSPSATTNAT